MIDIEKVMKPVKEKIKAGSNLLLHLPEGLKVRTLELTGMLEKAGYSVVIFNDPCYGACDIPDNEAKLLGCDYIIHIGHSKFYKNFKTSVPVLYIPLAFDVVYDKKELVKIKEKKLGIFSTVQYSHGLDQLGKDLKETGKEPVNLGEVLGCYNHNVISYESKVDAFVFMGTGRFHPTGLNTKKPVYILDLENGKIWMLDNDYLAKQQKIIMAKKEKLKDAHVIGILVSTKQGQFYHDYQKIKDSLQKQGKKVYVIAMDYITNDKLLGLKIDFFINTACPRISEDDFDKPVLNARDIEII